MARLFADGLYTYPPIDATAETPVREALAKVKPSGWLIEFPNGAVFVDSNSETLMRINLANGCRVTPLFAGEAL